MLDKTKFGILLRNVQPKKKGKRRVKTPKEILRMEKKQ